MAVVGCLERVDEDVGQGDAEGVGDVEAQRILQARQAASDGRVSSARILKYVHS